VPLTRRNPGGSATALPLRQARARVRTGRPRQVVVVHSRRLADRTRALAFGRQASVGRAPRPLFAGSHGRLDELPGFGEIRGRSSRAPRDPHLSAR
jgi:hypothetical protein